MRLGPLPLALLALLAIASCRDGKSAVQPPPQQPPPAGASAEARAETRRAEPELRPHPDYPTPALAGTQELFLLEEPPRGPHVTDVKLPDRSQLKFTDHAYCELA